MPRKRFVDSFHITIYSNRPDVLKEEDILVLFADRLVDLSALLVERAKKLGVETEVDIRTASCDFASVGTT